MVTEHYDAIIVGSGFGGSVMAYRLADAGLRVCLLERGRRYPPHSFPRAPHEMKRNFWDPSKRLYGMFNFWSFGETGALVSSGLGGGSLIYANVLLRKDEKWFQEELPGGGYRPWPVQYADLESHYARAEKMLNAQPYPWKDRTPKTRAMEEAARILRQNPAHQADGYEWGLPNLAVSFRSQPYNPMDSNNLPIIGGAVAETHPNLHNAPRQTCQLCGECDIGCNYGSKNTLDFNYLSEAERTGNIEIKDLCEVVSFTKTDGKFTAQYVRHNPDAENDAERKSLPVTITANRLILAAGTFGTTYLLLKNRSQFPRISPTLGARYQGNGDLLAFFRRDKKHDAAREFAPSKGPVITSYIRLNDTLDGTGANGRGFYVQDGGFPSFVNWLIEAPQMLPSGLKILKSWWDSLTGGSADTDLSKEVSDAFGKTLEAVSLLPMLNMGRAPATGTFSLKGKHLACDWQREDSADYFARVLEAGGKLATALGVDYEDNPLDKFFDQVLTAHPLGGCPMGDNEREGVVDKYGEVFNYPGLYVADGAVFPGPVGPNPSLTIAALSERFAERIIQQATGGN